MHQDLGPRPGHFPIGKLYSHQTREMEREGFTPSTRRGGTVPCLILNSLWLPEGFLWDVVFENGSTGFGCLVGPEAD